jgi:C4-dicarboxylate-binding protein DctP
VDGTENTPSNIYTQKMHEVQKFLTVTDHGYVGYAVIVNKKFWDGLPSDIRTALEGAMRDATSYGNHIAKQENDAAMEAIKKSGKTQIVALTPEEKHAWKAALLPVHNQMADKIGKDLIQAIYKATGFDPGQR